MPAGWPQRFCCKEELDMIGYDGREAQADLARWRATGPRAWTRELIDTIVGRGVTGATVVDVGAGVGAVHVGLLEAGAERAIDVDASREYQAAAQAEATRRGLIDRIEYRYGDMAELAPDLPPADVVTLDSVICCYPYLPRLLAAAAASSPRIIGLTYPRDTWWMILFMRLFNAGQWLRRSVARYFIYRHAQVRRLLADLGYHETHDGGTRAWRVSLFERS